MSIIADTSNVHVCFWHNRVMGAVMIRVMLTILIVVVVYFEIYLKYTTVHIIERLCCYMDLASFLQRVLLQVI